MLKMTSTFKALGKGGDGPATSMRALHTLTAGGAPLRDRAPAMDFEGATAELSDNTVAALLVGARAYRC